MFKTKLQKDIFLLLKIFIEKNRYIPTTRELSKLRGAKSHTSTYRILKDLVELGYIKKINGGKYIPTKKE